MIRYGVLLSTLFLSGCATTRPPELSASEFLASHRVLIGSKGYLPISAIVQKLHAAPQWDRESLVYSFSVGSHQLRVAPGMPVVLIDGVPQTVTTVPAMSQGELFLPEELWTRWMGQWGPPPPQAPPVALGRGLKTIILDPGHGGHDPGAISRSGLREKSVTLDVALRLRDLLQEDGFQVIMTRADDRFISLSRRAQIANAQEGDMFVSIHANASRQRGVSGYEVYYLSEATDDHARALEAAENAALPQEMAGHIDSEDTEAIVWDLLYTEHRAESTELASSVCRGLKRERIPSQNRGVKSARFAVLKGSRMPAVLVEIGFITHKAEESRLRSASYRQILAEGIRSGIVAFRNQYERHES